MKHHVYHCFQFAWPVLSVSQFIGVALMAVYGKLRNN